jgi:hypothetical protein
VAHILESNGVVHFTDPYTEGFNWSPTDGTLNYPSKPARAPRKKAQEREPEKEVVLSGVKAKTWFAGTEKVKRRQEG